MAKAIKTEAPEAQAHGTNAIIYAVARSRVDRLLDSMWKTFGAGKPTEGDRERLMALMDGAQDAWSEWVPMEYRR